MATDKQIEANRINAQKSTGPRTPEGRAAVRLNGLKHGLTASTLVVPGESEADFEDLLDSIEAEHQPATPTEEVIVRQIAMAAWRLRRYHLIEAGHLRTYAALETECDDDPDRAAGDLLGMAVRSDCRDSNTLANLSRYEARLERSLYQGLHELERLRAHRAASLKNQTQSPPVGRVSDPPINNIQTPAKVIPIDQPAEPREKSPHPAEPEADMQ